MLGGAVLWIPAQATDFQLPFGVEGNYKMTLSYSAAMRMEDPDPALLNGELDPLVPRVFPEGQIVGFDRTGLPTATNSDDGNRNFDKYSLINNRASILAEMSFERDNFAFLLSGNAWYDRVYMRENDNRNAEYLNRFGPDGRLPEQDNTNEFSSAMRSEVGRRARLLDAYLIADFPFGEASFLNVRVGQHVVSWGQALFFGGMARDMGVADANAGFVPGGQCQGHPVAQSADLGESGHWLRPDIEGLLQVRLRGKRAVPGGFLFFPVRPYWPWRTIRVRLHQPGIS